MPDAETLIPDNSYETYYSIKNQAIDCCIETMQHILDIDDVRPGTEAHAQMRYWLNNLDALLSDADCQMTIEHFIFNFSHDTEGCPTLDIIPADDMEKMKDIIKRMT